MVVDPPVQLQSISTEHEELHPSLLAVFPSSQYVEGRLVSIIFPSPQISLQTLAVEESPRVHVQSVSTPQVDEQPSLLAVLPSSQ